MTSAHRLKDWLQAEWYGKPHPNPLLLPLEVLFRGAVALRRRAYREHWKTSEKLPVPVIVVGNLSVGGTGKTPLVVWLAGFLRSRGFRPGLISRGYGGRGDEAPLAVDPDTDPRLAGDEPVLLARRTGCPVYVFPVRARAARALLTAADCDVLIADDGLQHYALARDIEIAVVDAARGLGNGHCLPAGPLREPPERLCSVDLVVYSGPAVQGGYAMTLEGGDAVNLRDERLRRPLAGFSGEALFALAGIGNPVRFFAHLRYHGLAFTVREFPDHHPFRPGDLRFAGDSPLFMTEKDAVKCRGFAGPNHWYVPVRARLPDAFGERLSTLLKEKCDGRKTA